MPEISPMIISIWCGEKKPNDVNAYLKRFVDELNKLIRYGLSINGYDIKVLVRCFICDTPARCFLKGME